MSITKNNLLNFFLILSALIILTFGYYINKPIYNPKISDLSYLLLSKEGRPLELRLSKNGYWRMPVRLEEIDDKFIKLLIAYEDKRFYQHSGVDMIALFRSLKNNIYKNKIESGASTITMQTARLIDPTIQRNYLGKIKQILFSWRLESQFSKNDILELYLTLAPYGGNIEGIKAASYAWLGKKPKNLTWSESAMLVSLPQSPEKRRPDLFPDESQKAKNLILSKVKNKFHFNEKFLEETYSESNIYKKRKIKSYAPHLFDKLFSKNNSIIESTIDFNTQILVSSIIEDYVSYYPSPINGASLILERKTGNVIAYVGSSDYLSKSRKGGNNFLEALRSPGSTLKPLIYSEALSRNLINPYEIFDDKKSLFGNYKPSNFNNLYDGKISLEEALKDSKNISAIETLKLVNPISFEKKIKHNFKIKTLNTDTSGLTLAVGGLYLSAENLAEMYLTLANEGNFNDLKFLNHEFNNLKKNKLFKKSATNNVLSLLSKYDKNGKKITLKTGTSYDQQDAWAAMITKNHVIISWLGTPDNTPTQILIGSQDAEPMAIKIATMLNYDSPSWKMDQLFMKTNKLRKINKNNCELLISQPLNNDTILTSSEYFSVKTNLENITWFINGKLTKKNLDSLKIPNYGFLNLSAKKGDCIETINIFIKQI